MYKIKLSVFILTILLYFNGYSDGLEGVIKDHSTQSPISGAIIWLEGTDYIDTTDISGYYKISNIPSGKYNILIGHDNYKLLVYNDFLIDNTVSVEEKEDLSNPTEFNLEQNYPNPFNPSTKINYQIPESGFVSLKVYNILGNEVMNLVNENKAVGRYTVTFNASSLSSGVYIYAIKVNDFQSVKKMLLMK